MSILNRRHIFLEKVVQEAKNALADGRYRCETRAYSYRFSMITPKNLEIYSLQWEIHRSFDELVYNTMRINGRTQKIPPIYGRQIAEASAEYAVMHKLG